MNHTQTWILTANESLAKIFRLGPFPHIEEIHAIEHPESRLLNQELVSSKPGRVFDRGGINRHSYEPKSDPQTLEIEKFAKEISVFLGKALQNKEFQKLYVFAGPAFLGFLRQSLSAQVQACIISEVDKDIVHEDKNSIEKRIKNLSF